MLIINVILLENDWVQPTEIKRWEIGIICISKMGNDNAFLLPFDINTCPPCTEENRKHFKINPLQTYQTSQRYSINLAILFYL